jgi:nucleotide-binding universal stress UspA family protein
MPNPILAGYCSRTADRGPVDFAVAAARATGAHVLAVAIHSGSPVADFPVGGELADQPEHAARAALESLRDEFGATVDVRAREALTAAAGLTAVAEEVDARVIVLGSSRRGALGRVVPGSTAERVVNGAPCPVAVVPRDYAVPAGGITTVGAAFAPTPEGREALRAAALLADAAGASLRVIMVLDPALALHSPPGRLATAHHDQDAAEDRAGRSRIAAERALDDAIAAVSPTAPVERAVLVQDPAEGLAAASGHLDLLVMGSRAYGPMRAVMLGGVSRRVITRATCPLLVLPRGPGSAVEALVPTADAEHAAG